jgi:uncharacterized protein YxjI
MRFAGDIDQFFTHTLSVYDARGERVLELTRPRLVKSRLLVKTGDDRTVGQIVQDNVFGKIRFNFVGLLNEEVLGRIKAENWRAWDFSIVDATDHEVGRIEKKFVGVAKAIFTTGDNYIVDISDEAQGDLRLMALAASVAVDTALKQDARGFSVTDVIDI